MSYENILVETRGRVGLITLNRPKALNALNDALMDELGAALLAFDADANIGAIVITGSEKAFAAGADIGAMADYDFATVYKNEYITRNWETIRRIRKPVIAAVNGAAVGVGVTMQLPMDIRIASTDAKFGFVFARRGITPEAASSWFLPRLVGVSTALEWSYTGKVFPAAEAQERGLVRSVHAPDELLRAAQAICREIIDNTAPVSIALTRQMMWRNLGAAPPMDAHRVDSRAIQSRGASGDAKEGVGAFLEKRPPAYPNRVSADLPDIWPEWSPPEFR